MLGSIAGRLATTCTAFLLIFGGVFHLILGTEIVSPTYDRALLDETAIGIIMLSMLALTIGVGVGAERRWYKSPSFWKYLCSSAVTMLVIVGAHNINFGALSEFVASAVAFYASPFAMVTLVLTGVSTVAYIYFSQSWEPAWETVVTVPVIGLLATLLFAKLGGWAGVAILLGGILHLVISPGDEEDEEDGREVSSSVSRIPRQKRSG